MTGEKSISSPLYGLFTEDSLISQYSLEGSNEKILDQRRLWGKSYKIYLNHKMYVAIFSFLKGAFFSSQDDCFLSRWLILCKSDSDLKKVNFRPELVKYLHKAT